MADMISRNQMTVETLKTMQADSLHIKPNPKKPGHFFFTCGSIEAGYISPNALKAIQNGAKAENLKFAECSLDGNKWVPCIMVVGKQIADAYTL